MSLDARIEAAKREGDQATADRLRELAGLCERCHAPGASRGTVMTAYPDEESNRPPLLCPECEEQRVAHWEAMWDEYHANQG